MWRIDSAATEWVLLFLFVSILLENIRATQSYMKFTILRATRKFITLFVRIRHWYLTCADSVQSTLIYFIPLTPIWILFFGLHVGFGRGQLRRNFLRPMKIVGTEPIDTTEGDSPVQLQDPLITEVVLKLFENFIDRDFQCYSKFIFRSIFYTLWSRMADWKHGFTHS